MLKKSICVLFAMLLLSGFAIAETDFSFLDTYSQNDLIDLQKEVSSRITNAQYGDTVYDKDGIAIQWQGLVKEGSQFKVALIVTNNTENTIFFEISKIALNSIEIGPTANGYTKAEINSGWSFYTPIYYSWLTDFSICDQLNINKITNVKLRTDIFDSSELDANLISSLFFDFPVDLDLSEIKNQ